MKYVGKRQKPQFDPKYIPSGKIIHSLYKKYGSTRFRIKLIDCALSKAELCDLEKMWIKDLDCLWPKGYNIAPGGEGGMGTKNHKLNCDCPFCKAARGETIYLSEEQKELLRKPISKESRMKWVGKKYVYNPNLDTETRVKEKELSKYLSNGWIRGRKPFSKEHRKNISESHAGLSQSIESNKKRSKTMTGKNKGKKNGSPSKESREKNSQSHLGKASGTTHMYNLDLQQSKMVKPEDIQSYLSNGYKFGVLPGRKRPTANAAAKLANEPTKATETR